MSLFERKGFKLREWSANFLVKPVFLRIRKCELGFNIREIDVSSDRMPDSKALGLKWDEEKDIFKIYFDKTLNLPPKLSRSEKLHFLFLL